MFLLIFLIVMFVFGIIFYFTHKPFKYTVKLIIHGVFLMPNKIKRIGETQLTAEQVVEFHKKINEHKISITYNELLEFVIKTQTEESKKSAPTQLLESYKKINEANLQNHITKENLMKFAVNGGDIPTMVDALIKAHKEEITYDINSLVTGATDKVLLKSIVDTMSEVKAVEQIPNQAEITTYLKKEGKKENLMKAYKEAIKENVELKIDFLIKIHKDGGDVLSFANTLVKARKIGLSIPVDKLNDAAGNHAELILKLMIRAKESGLSLTVEELTEHLRIGGDIEKMVTTLIKAQEFGIKTSIKELERFFIIDGDIEVFLTALRDAKKAKLDLPPSKLFELHLTGGNISKLIKAIMISGDLGITRETIEADFIDGKDVLGLVGAVGYAKKAGLPLNYQLAGMLGDKLNDVIKMSLNPKLLTGFPDHGIAKDEHHVPEDLSILKIVAQDGIELLIKPSITVRVNILQYLRGSGEEVIYDRVKEALADEIIQFHTHEQVFENRDEISHKVIKRLNGLREPLPEELVEKDKFTLEEELKRLNDSQIELNRHSKYEILDISLSDIRIGDDTYSEIRRKHAEHHAHEIMTKAEAEVKSSEALLQEAFAEAIRNGTITNINELHKYKIYNQRLWNEKQAAKKEETTPKDSHDAGQGHGNVHGGH